MITLRPHHCACLPRFVGKGYDEAFTENTARVLYALNSEPGQAVTLATAPDELCSKCPHMLSGECANIGKVKTLDSRWLEELGLKPGDSLSWSELKRRTTSVSTQRLHSLCGSCQWFELCKSIELL